MLLLQARHDGEFLHELLVVPATHRMSMSMSVETALHVRHEACVCSHEADMKWHPHSTSLKPTAEQTRMCVLRWDRRTLPDYGWQRGLAMPVQHLDGLQRRQLASLKLSIMSCLQDPRPRHVQRPQGILTCIRDWPAEDSELNRHVRNSNRSRLWSSVLPVVANSNTQRSDQS